MWTKCGQDVDKIRKKCGNSKGVSKGNRFKGRFKERFKRHSKENSKGGSKDIQKKFKGLIWKRLDELEIIKTRLSIIIVQLIDSLIFRRILN